MRPLITIKNPFMLESGVLNGLNQAFMHDFKGIFRQLDCSILTDEQTGNVTLLFNRITRTQNALVHNLCNAHRRDYVIERDEHPKKLRVVIHPPKRMG